MEQSTKDTIARTALTMIISWGFLGFLSSFVNLEAAHSMFVGFAMAVVFLFSLVVAEIIYPHK